MITVLVGVSVILTVAAPLNSSLRGAVVPIVVTTSLVVVVVGILLGRVRTLQPAELGESGSDRGSEPGVQIPVR